MSLVVHKISTHFYISAFSHSANRRLWQTISKALKKFNIYHIYYSILPDKTRPLILEAYWSGMRAAFLFLPAGAQVPAGFQMDLFHNVPQKWV